MPNNNKLLEGEQLVAFDLARAFIERGSDQQRVLEIQGLAGTGKTEIIRHLVGLYDLPVHTLSGKAFSVLRERGIKEGGTIHSFLYGRPTVEKLAKCGGCNTPYSWLEDDNHCPKCQAAVASPYSFAPDGTLKIGCCESCNHPLDKPRPCPSCSAAPAGRIEEILHWPTMRLKPGSAQGQTIIIDESSMVGADIGADLLTTGVRILAFGDQGQLPPVKAKPFFINPKIRLTTLRRQGAGSAIAAQAKAVYEGGAYRPVDDTFQVCDNPQVGEILDAGAVICWKNKTRHLLTSAIRRKLGIDPASPPRIGEPVLIMKNHRDVYNGEIHRLAENYNPREQRLILDRDHGVVREMRNMVLEDLEIAPPKGRNKFYFGYVLTAHKAQGSEWDNVVVVDEIPRDNADRRRWVYTAMTRARKKVIMAPFRS